MFVSTSMHSLEVENDVCTFPFPYTNMTTHVSFEHVMHVIISHLLDDSFVDIFYSFLANIIRYPILHAKGTQNLFYSFQIESVVYSLTYLKEMMLQIWYDDVISDYYCIDEFIK